MRAIWLAALLFGCNACRSTQPADRWHDDAPHAECTDACACAEANLRTACPELVGDDFGAWCQAMLDNHQPICAIRLASVANCKEADEVCR